jgi:exodeoxyribonuclease V alpha subunit
MLQRNLFYTGITRAKKICIVVGTSNAVKSAVNNTRETKRNTTLKERLISKIK